MRRHLYISAPGSALAAAMISAPANSATISTAITTPVRTATANNGNPDAITITSAGSVKPASGTAVTQDSNHAVTNQGTIAISNSDGAIGIKSAAGTNGDIVNSGTITIDETYTPTDANNDGDLDGPFSLGSNRFGIRTEGAHTGKITNSGTITVEGNDSAGIWLGGAQNGAFTHDGTTTVVGDRSVGVHAGDITGNVRLAGTVTATGEDAVGAEFKGNVNGAMVVQGNISSTGYRYTTAPSNPANLDADDLLQGGSALVIEGNVTGGIVLAVPPKDNSTTDNDEDDDGIEDSKEGSAKVTTYGAAPAMVVGATDHDIAIGAVAGTPTQFGLQIEGSIAGHGIYAGVDGNGLLIGGRGGNVTIANGMSISGSITATSKDRNATALRIGSGASVPEVRVSGTVSATGGNSATAKSTAVQVDAGATVNKIANSGQILATVGGADGNATAILDLSGGVTLVENSGKIAASGAAASSTRNVAIDLSANTTGVVVKQTQVGSGFAAPVIQGDVRFGSGNDLFEIADGTVTGNAYFGAGNNSLSLLGDGVFTGKAFFGSGNDAMTLAGTSAFNGTADFAGGGTDTLTLGGTSVFRGALANSSHLAVAVNGGYLDVTQPANIASLNVGASGTLVATLDKDAGQGSLYNVSGTANFASGATVLVRLADTQDAEGRYTILEAGTLTGASGIKTKTDLVPFMFKATMANDVGPNKLAVDIKKKTTTELGLNRSQSAAYNAIFEALAEDQEIEDVFLAITNGEAFRNSVRMMMPDHAGGAFESVSLGTRAFARQAGDPYGPVYKAGGLDIIISGAGWSSTKDEGDTAAFDLGGFGFSLGGEIQTGIGSFGISGQWLWSEYSSLSEDNRVLSDTYEIAGYWRGQWGKINAWARGSYGIVNFNGRRTFMATLDGENIERSAIREWDGRLTTFSGGASYEGGGKTFFYRPSVTFDYVRLSEDGYTDTGGGDGFNLIVEDRTSDELAVNAGLTVGLDFMGNRRVDRNWFRVEAEGGWRSIVGGELGATTAHFKDGDEFTLTPDQGTDGWYARLRAHSGNSEFSMGGELSAEQRHDHTAIAIRGTLRMGF